MSTLRKLFEEALMEKGGEALLKKGDTGNTAYTKRLKQGGQWPGGNIYHDEFGKFTSKDDSTSVSWGSKKLAKSGRSPGAGWGKNVVKGKAAGRMSGSGKSVKSKQGRGGSYTPKSSKAPSDSRVVLRTGKKRKDSPRLGSRYDRFKQIANLALGSKASKADRAKWAKAQVSDAPKKQVRRPKGRKAAAAAAAAANAFDYYENAENLFLARLQEGHQEDQHPLTYVDSARQGISHALESLNTMPDAVNYQEVVEAIEHLDYADDLLDYDEE